METAAPALLSPSHHALRGVSATLAAGALLATASWNRRALLSFKASQLAAFKLARPSRNALAIAVFVGVFRYIERRDRKRKDAEAEKTPSAEAEKAKDGKDETNKRALVAAAVACMLALRPDSRTPLVALVATNAASTWFQAFLAAHPELAALKPLELVVFMFTGGWILYSGFFHPDSYEPSHMRLIMKYSLTSQHTATFLQERYRQGLNPTTCDARHAGRGCAEFFFATFLWKTIAMGLRIYAPVHVTTWLIALRHHAVRAKPTAVHLRQLATRIVRSAMYYIVFILVGWTSPCLTNAVGSRSLAWRKAQFLVCGSVPALSILFEAESRRRPIGVILSSYAFVSMGTVLAQHRRLWWLQQGSGAARTLLDVVVTAASVAYTFGGLIDSSIVLQRMLLGGPTKSRVRRFSRVGNGRGGDDVEKHAGVEREST